MTAELPAPSAATSAGAPLDPYDAVVLLSFGGPEGPDEVMPFLRRVTAGRGIPDERLAEVATHYVARDGVSPINEQNRQLVAALSDALRAHDSDIPVVLANRNSQPFLPEVLQTLQAKGARRLVVITTSGYSSYSSCRQYRENLAEAVAGLDGDLLIDKVEPWFGHPGFVDTMAEATVATLMTRVPPTGTAGSTIVLFVTHSIPEAMDATSGPGDEEGHAYSQQHRAVADRILDAVHADVDADLRGELVFCSRSGRPGQPWLEPDVGDRLRELATEGITQAVLVPIGFVSDHMEVLNDLDTVAAAQGAEVGITVHRVPTVGTAPAFVDGLVDLLFARASIARGEPAVAAHVVSFPAPPPVCRAGCCPNLREVKPALCGEAP